MNISDLEKKLADAERRLEQILQDRKRTTENLLDAFDARDQARRALAAAKGEDYAVPYDIGFEPEAAVPSPLLFASERLSILMFRAVRRVSKAKCEAAGWGIVEFSGSVKFGYPNDEALPGHPLYNRGLGCYGVFEVMNSAWLKQQTEQNRVEFPNTPDSAAHHFVFTFHDSTLECITHKLQFSLTTEAAAIVLAKIYKKASENSDADE